MDAKNITIFSYSKNQSPSSSARKNIDLKRLFREKFNSEKQNLVGEKHGSASSGKQMQLMKMDKEIIPQPPQELIPIDESKNINVHITTERQELEILESMRRKSNRLLISISSVFPLEVFPTKINIQETRVSVIFHDLLSTHIHSLDIKDITNVFIESAYLFANLKIITRTFIENDVKISKLRKNEAVYARRLIEGLRLFCAERIDTSKYEVPDLVRKLEDISECESEI